MTIGQIVFLSGMLLFIVYVVWVRRRTMDRVLFILFGVVGAILILFPTFTTVVASWLGIGRGTDLVIYIFMILCLFYAVSTSAEINRIKAQLTALTRKDAVENPIRMKKG
jgi:hypothetical protein